MIWLAMLLAAAAQDGTVTARQTTLSVDEVLGGKGKQSKTERDADKETRRHNEEMEKQFKELRQGDSVFSLRHSGDAFTLGRAKQRKPGRTRSLPPNANRY